MKKMLLAIAVLVCAPCAADDLRDGGRTPDPLHVAMRPDGGEAFRRLRERASTMSAVTPVPTAAGTAAKAAGRTYFVTGRVVPADRPLAVRVYSTDGRFVTSTEQFWTNGTFYLNLPAGDYMFEADDNLEYIGSPFFYRAPKRSGPIRISNDTTLPPIQRNVASGEFVLIAVLPCDLVGAGKFVPVLIDATAVSADGARIQRSVYADEESPASVENGCAIRYHVVLSPGTYAIAVSPLGWPSRTIGDITIAADQHVEHEEDFSARDRNLVWRGTLFDTDGRPATGAFALAYSPTDDLAPAPWPDVDGRFEIPYRPGWAVEFERGPFGNDHSSVNHLEILGDTPPPSRIAIEALPFEAVPEDGMLRLYGNGDRLHRFNILFLGDGYTDAHETYTDSNGNGVWDGYVWYDFDHDGVLGDADRYAFYGNALPLEPGQVPSEAGEPFVDVNGDGALSIDDEALFEINARSFLRALFASDFWKDHRDALNAYTLYEPSPQAGASVHTLHGERIDRATRYHPLIEDVGTVSFDRAAALRRARAVLPDVDVVVMLVNDQIGYPAGSVVGGEPGTIGFIAGPYFTWSRDLRPAHQLAHLIAGLCDEEGSGDLAVADDAPPAAGCPNTSASPADVPWRAWLPSDMNEPSRDLVAGTGIYESVDDQYRRIYRPAYQSVMSGRSVLLDAPSRAALERAVRLRAQALPRGHSVHARTDDPSP